MRGCTRFPQSRLEVVGNSTPHLEALDLRGCEQLTNPSFAHPHLQSLKLHWRTQTSPPQKSPVASPPQKAAVASPLSMRAVLAAEPLTRAQREERDIEALSVDELKQRIVATARRRRERRAQLQVAEAYVY